MSSKLILSFQPNLVTNKTWLQTKTCTYTCVSKGLFHEEKKEI